MPSQKKYMKWLNAKESGILQGHHKEENLFICARDKSEETNGVYDILQDMQLGLRIFLAGGRLKCYLKLAGDSYYQN